MSDVSQRSAPTSSGTMPARRADSERAAPIGPSQPAVDLRIVLFTVARGALRLAVINHSGTARLPRGPADPGESLDTDAAAIIREQLGISERYLEQLYTFSAAGPDKWSVIVAYVALVSSDEMGEPVVHGTWQDTDDPHLGEEIDRRVVDYAVVRLRAKLSYTTIAFHLLPSRFTMGELQRTYEVVLHRPLDKRNFRRRILGADILDPTEGKRRDGNHRPAVLYEFRPPHDREQFLTPSWVDGPST